MVKLYAYWRTSLEKEMHLFKVKKSYSYDDSDICR